MAATSKKTFNPDFKNPPRIINDQVELVSVARIKNHPDNARKGDIQEIADSIEENGFFGYLIAQKSTGYILAGNHTFLAGISKGMHEFPVLWLDIDDEAALRILAVDNATSDRAEYHEEKQAALLSKLALLSERGLKGSGYQQKHLDALKDRLAKKAEKSSEGGGTNKKKGDGDDRYAIVIVCESPAEQEERIIELEDLGLKPRRTILNERTKLALG